ncbi:4-(cytidine 5'-diphospho)-2-C-methyl-D-erythritol kinase [Schaalia sp. 19OD2882]|nr:4-(cytidine 5'-diphospho)-2-C-methyl-D-erythritol kinase [Schaalia sp. 19OD2882]QWW20607.1 4-(cytidine 5'-diphospho)-2-C-methyl-D-erythritol kinase [Schaalia sp. 19OD2882]
MREVHASAPGKVNLTLHAGRPTGDGHHPLVTVFEALDLREHVRVRTSRTPGIRVSTTARLPTGEVDRVTTEVMAAVEPEAHLAVRAAKVMQRLAMSGPWAATAAGLVIEVDKYVPVAGGMAGGSADAAAALVACNDVWGLGLDLARLQAIGRTLGADVPACLVGGVCLGTGRGDHMRLLTPGDEDAPAHHWVLALAHGGLSTPAVFARLDADGGPAGGWYPLDEPGAEEVATLTGTSAQLAGALVNDLQDAALGLRPELATTLAAAREAGALGALVSGSGPTIAALAADRDAARDLAEALSQAPHVKRTVITRGPVAGARIETVGGID